MIDAPGRPNLPNTWFSKTPTTPPALVEPRFRAVRSKKPALGNFGFVASCVMIFSSVNRERNPTQHRNKTTPHGHRRRKKCKELKKQPTPNRAHKIGTTNAAAPNAWKNL